MKKHSRHYISSYEHKRVINENSEHTKYAVYNNHPAIITKGIFDTFQKNVEVMKQLTRLELIENYKKQFQKE